MVSSYIEYVIFVVCFDWMVHHCVTFETPIWYLHTCECYIVVHRFPLQGRCQKTSSEVNQICYMSKTIYHNKTTKYTSSRSSWMWFTFWLQNGGLYKMTYDMLYFCQQHSCPRCLFIGYYTWCSRYEHCSGKTHLANFWWISRQRCRSGWRWHNVHNDINTVLVILGCWSRCHSHHQGGSSELGRHPRWHIWSEAYQDNFKKCFYIRIYS